jgi:hypothetical protein
LLNRCPPLQAPCLALPSAVISTRPTLHSDVVFSPLLCPSLALPLPVHRTTCLTLPSAVFVYTHVRCLVLLCFFAFQLCLLYRCSLGSASPLSHSAQRCCPVFFFAQDVVLVSYSTLVQEVVPGVGDAPPSRGLLALPWRRVVLDEVCAGLRSMHIDHPRVLCITGCMLCGCGSLCLPPPLPARFCFSHRASTHTDSLPCRHTGLGYPLLT